MCSNPEFLREGSAIQDFTHPDRVLVGVEDARARGVMERLYEPLRLRNAPVMFVSRESAELAKYAANAFLAMKISFINEIADLCEEVGANVQEVAQAIGSDGRIGDKFLHPGPGYGGSCFPKDVSALARTAREARAPLTLVEQVEKVNNERKIAMAHKVIRAAGGDVFGKTIAVLGVTFKQNTDDMRDAPALVIVPMLQERGAIVRVYDPQGKKQAEPLLPGVTWCGSVLEAAEGADAAVVLTEWNEFRAVSLEAMKAKMRGNVLADLRNIYRPSHAREAGLRYVSIGRPESCRTRSPPQKALAGPLKSTLLPMTVQTAICGGLEPLGRDRLPDDTAELARFLIGKLVMRALPSGLAAGRIVETEAYLAGDEASHAFRGMTPRNKVMFGPKGYAYVYLIYGMYFALNVSGAAEGVGEAVLIRAAEPVLGLDVMAQYRGGVPERDLMRGPGRLAKALDIDRSLDGANLCTRGALWLSCDGQELPECAVSTRIGITRDAHRPLRFFAKGSRYVSGPASLNRGG